MHSDRTVFLSTCLFSLYLSVVGASETQRQALGLLHCIMSDDRGVEVVIEDQRIVAYVMACLLTSKCRFNSLGLKKSSCFTFYFQIVFCALFLSLLVLLLSGLV